MSTPSQRRRSAALRPVPETLEGRVVLSKTIHGVDIDGDRWTLKLLGPGDFRVTTQNDTPLNQPSLIKDITLAGGTTVESRLEGSVKKGPNGDGKVFFQNLISLNNPQVPDINGVIRIDGNGRGLNAIDMPRFWLGDTSNGTFTPATGSPQAQINVATGVTALRFGGVDTTAFTAPTTRGAAYEINLGLPQVAGTSIIVDQIISQNRPATTTGGSPNLDTVAINVQGRLNLFQANAVRGDATEATGPYAGPNTGGTTISDTPDAAGTTGQIGFVRIGGEATNLTVAVTGPTGTPDNARISDFYIGGETNKVVVTVPGGMRNVKFGRGMDSVAITTRNISHLVANRGAVGSQVVSNGPITLANFGGSVVNSRILSGYFDSTTTGQTFDVGGGGQMTVTVGGDIKDSVFASSAVPLDADGIISFDAATSILYEKGFLKAKHEGAIDNSNLFDFAPNKAFFAKSLQVSQGPTQPPNVVEPPYATPSKLHRGQIGLTKRGGLLGTYSVSNLSTPLIRKKEVKVPRAAKVSAQHVVTASTAVPQGPAAATTPGQAD